MTNVANGNATFLSLVAFRSNQQWRCVLDRDGYPPRVAQSVWGGALPVALDAIYQRMKHLMGVVLASDNRARGYLIRVSLVMFVGNGITSDNHAGCPVGCA